MQRKWTPHGFLKREYIARKRARIRVNGRTDRPVRWNPSVLNLNIWRWSSLQWIDRKKKQKKSKQVWKFESKIITSIHHYFHPIWFLLLVISVHYLKYYSFKILSLFSLYSFKLVRRFFLSWRIKLWEEFLFCLNKKTLDSINYQSVITAVLQQRQNILYTICLIV